MKKYIVFTITTLILLTNSCGFEIHHKDTELIPDHLVTFGLQENNTDNILVSANNGLFFYNPIKKNYKKISNQPNRKIPLVHIIPHPTITGYWIGKTNNCVYVSKDDGFHWKIINRNLQVYSNSFLKIIDKTIHFFFPSYSIRYTPYINDVLIQKNGDKLFCASEKGFFKMEFDKRNWIQIKIPLQVNYFVSILEIQEIDSLLLLSDSNELYLYSLSQKSFEQIHSTISSPIIKYAYRSEILTTATPNNIILSSLSRISGKTNIVNFKCIEESTTYNSTFLLDGNIAIQHGLSLFVYGPNGLVLRQLPNDKIIDCLNYSHLSKTFYFLVNESYLCHTKDFIQWDKEQKSIHNSVISGFCSSYHESNYILSYTRENGVFYSLDSGNNWKAFSKDLLFKTFTNICSFRDKDGVFVGSTDTELYIIKDTCVNLVSIPDKLKMSKYQITSLFISSSLVDESILIAIWNKTTEKTLIFRTFNEGVSWESLEFDLRVNCLEDSVEGEILIGTNQGLFIGSFIKQEVYPVSFEKSITTIKKDISSSVYFVGTLEGLYTVTISPKVIYEELYDDLNLNKISFLFIEFNQNSRIFVSSGEYLYLVQNEEPLKYQLPSEIEQFTYEPFTKTIFVSTQDTGYKAISTQ